MAITSFDPRNPRVMSRYGISQVTRTALEANSQSFKAGEFVAWSSGTVIAGTAGDKPIAGIALKDATNVTSGNIAIPIQIIGPDDEVLIQVEDGSGNLEAANTTAVPGAGYPIIVSSNHHRLNSSTNSNPQLVFIEPVLDANGDATYWARCRPVADENQVTGAV